MRPVPITPGAGQESVWDFPRPPRLEKTSKRLQIIFNGVTIADTSRGYRVLETSHPPTYYLPAADIETSFLRPAGGSSLCEWKGAARYFTVQVGDKRLEKVAWTYPEPTPNFLPLRDHYAFYAGPMDSCMVDGVPVTPQPGGFYGGWITPDITGPFKGAPGSTGW